MARLRLSRWLLLMIGVAVVPLVLILFYNLYVLHAAREREVRQEVSQVGQLLGLEMQRLLSGFSNILITVSAAPAVKGGNSEACAEFLNGIVGRVEGIASLGVIKADGTVWCRQDARGIGTSMADRPYFRDALASKDVVVGEFTESRITGQRLLPMVISIRDTQGNVSGVVALSVDLSWLQKIIANRAIPKDAAITIADKGGTIIARYPFPERFVGTKIPSNYAYLLTAGEPGTLEVLSQDGTQRLMAYFPVNSIPKGIYISTGLSVAEKFDSIRQATVLGILITLLTLTLALGLTWRVSRYAIGQPVKQILGAIDAWKANHLEARTRLDGDDEFGEIGAAFDNMADQLEQARKQNELVAAELDHRMKNVLALVLSVARQTFKRGVPSEDATQLFQNRVLGIAATFTALRAGGSQSVNLMQLVQTATAPFQTQDNPQVKIEGPEVIVCAKAAVPLGMALHELATNAVKYGALSHSDGEVVVSWEVQKEGEVRLILLWQERNGPPVTAPEKTGFGTNMIQRALSAQLHAEVQTIYELSGIRCEISAPLDGIGVVPQTEPA